MRATARAKVTGEIYGRVCGCSAGSMGPSKKKSNFRSIRSRINRASLRKYASSSARVAGEQQGGTSSSEILSDKTMRTISPPSITATNTRIRKQFHRRNYSSEIVATDSRRHAAETRLPRLPAEFPSASAITFNHRARADRKTRKDTFEQPLKRIYYTEEDNPLGNEVKLRNPFCDGGRGCLPARVPLRRRPRRRWLPRANTGTTLVTYGCGLAGCLAAFQTEIWRYGSV